MKITDFFRRLGIALQMEIPVTDETAEATDILNQYKKYFRNKYWIGVSELNAEAGVIVTKGNGTRIRLVNPRSFWELFTEIERIAKLEV